MPSHRGRLAHLAAHRTRRDARWDMLAYHHRLTQSDVWRAKLIRAGLLRLGIDPARAAKIAGVEQAEARLAGLAPLPAGYVHPPPDEDTVRAARACLLGAMERFMDPATPAPDFDKASQYDLLAYLLTRVPGLVAACDTVSDAQGLTPADGKEDSSGPN